MIDYDKPLAFVMPHYSDQDSNIGYLQKAIQSILNQTDPNWKLIIIDDSSSSIKAIEYLKNIQIQHPERIEVIFNTINNGPGYCRNIGIKWAKENSYPIILFLDSDDICHENRVNVSRRIFSNNSNASVVYSTFTIIDENDNLVPASIISPSIKEIIDLHKVTPPQGNNTWIEIGTITGLINLTSATSVRTELACRFLFPNERVSEDVHTWYRYSAGGNDFIYTDEIPTLYRIPSNTEGSSSRSREGGKYIFYSKAMKVNEDGFLEAIELALNNKKIKQKDVNELMIKFFLKQYHSMFIENEIEIAKSQIEKAMKISKNKTIKLSAGTIYKEVISSEIFKALLQKQS